MVSIVSRSEFPPEDDEDDVDVTRRNTHHLRTMGSRKKITDSPVSDARRIGGASAPLEAPPPYSRPEYVGTTIDGRYFVEKPLGEGGMGVVYLCRHTIIDKKVAMKVLRADLARNEEVTERFLNEARSASSIGNPHIIDISDFGRLPDGATYFVMEYLTGTSLADIVDQHEPIEPARIGYITLQLCEGLAAAHSAGIVHRDLKPDNIFLVNQGSRTDFVKILDFGIAKASRMPVRLTQAGQVFGTPHYMSPEQASGAEVDLRSDIYSVGVILYELATGELPFDADNFMAILTQHMHKAPPAPSSIEGLAPLLPGLQELILKCLAKDPADRYQTMPELMGDLRAVFSDVLPAAPELPHGDRYSVPQAIGRPASSKPQVQSAKPQRHFGLYAGIGAASLLLAASTVWLVRSAEPPSVREVEIPDPPVSTEQTAAQPNTGAAREATVVLTVVPATAHIFQGESDLGESPIAVHVGAEPVVLQVRAPGYRAKTVTVDGQQSKHSIALERDTQTAPPKALRAPAHPSNSASRSAPAATTSAPKRNQPSDGVVNPWE